MTDIGIGRLAELTGVKVPTIRFYEQTGLLAPPSRTEGGQRRYDRSAARRLNFIRHAREFGFGVNDIRQLLEIADHPTMTCETAMEIARHHLDQVEGKIARLRLIRSELRRMIERCGGGSAADCRILEGLAQVDQPIRRTKIRQTSHSV
jgi:DNA-binding transcriptional MerR regulator